jgi:UDP-glucose 4-epimerase
MKYLLLGGAGFIGTHLAKKLIAAGHSVVILDSCVTSSEPKYTVEFYNQDILNSRMLEGLVAECDVVYFLAGSVGVKHIVEQPYKTLLNNISLAAKVIPYIAQQQKLVLFTSTSEVYGNGPFSESNNLDIGSPENLRWSYASAKLTTEFMIASCGAPYRILRLFNIVGPGQLADYGMVLPRFINAAKTGQDIIVHGDGSQYRAFCHVSDAIDMIHQLEKVGNGIYNIGNDQATTILELAQAVKLAADSQSKIVNVDLNEVYVKNGGDIHKRVPDLSKLKRSINYKLNYNLLDIIKDML